MPLKAWIKAAFDHVIPVCLGEPDLEFAWVSDDAVDPLQQAQTLNILVGAGIKTIAEARAELGLTADGKAAALGKFNPNHDEARRFADAAHAVEPGADDATKKKGVQVAANQTMSVHPNLGASHLVSSSPEGGDRSTEEIATRGDRARSIAICSEIALPTNDCGIAIFRCLQHCLESKIGQSGESTPHLGRARVRSASFAKRQQSVAYGGSCMKLQTATAVTRLMMDVSAQLDASVKLVMDSSHPDEFAAYRTSVGNLMGPTPSRAARATRCVGRRECDRKLRYLREAIGHIDATLSLFDPNGDPKEVAAKRPYKRVKLFASGRLGRLVLDALRRGARPMTTREIVASIVEKVGYGTDAAKSVSHRVRSSLLYQSKVVGRVVKTGERESRGGGLPEC